MKLNKLVMVFGVTFFFAISQVCNASGWISSGGELFKDSHNPWFLSKNTPEIRYCVNAEGGSISISPDRLPVLIELAFEYWKKEFERINKFITGPAMAAVGKFTLARTGCNGSEDVRFQFGYETLTREQIEFLKSPSKYLAVSVRTQYDEGNLKGRGFVYVSSDIGPHKYEASAGSVDRPWAQEGILYRVLIHEIGHIFGIPHVSDGVFRFARTGQVGEVFVPIMSESYPELILKYPEAYKALTPPPSFLGYLDKYENCGLSENAKKLFQVSPEWKCIGVRFRWDSNANGTDPFAEMYVQDKITGREKSLGSIAVSDPKKDITFDFRALITVNLTPNQTLFELPKEYPLAYLIGPGLLTMNFSATLKSKDATEIPVFLMLDSGSWKLQGIVDNKIVSIVE